MTSLTPEGIESFSGFMRKDVRTSSHYVEAIYGRRKMVFFNLDDDEKGLPRRKRNCQLFMIYREP